MTENNAWSGRLRKHPVAAVSQPSIKQPDHTVAAVSQPSIKQLDHTVGVADAVSLPSTNEPDQSIGGADADCTTHDMYDVIEAAEWVLREHDIQSIV
jgi:hypothetical protein